MEGQGGGANRTTNQSRLSTKGLLLEAVFDVIACLAYLQQRALPHPCEGDGVGVASCLKGSWCVGAKAMCHQSDPPEIGFAHGRYDCEEINLVYHPPQ